MKSRNFPSFVDAFQEYTSSLPSPPLFRKWAAIATVAGALERKVWVRSRKSNLYPNLYTVLCGPPGVGKTVLTSQVWNLWDSLVDPQSGNNHYIASSSITKASLIDDLREAERRIVQLDKDPPMLQFNSLLICSNELGVLIPAYDSDFMNTLTDIYDGHPYSERRRTKDLHFKIQSPQINLLAATTPSYLTSMLPEGAWDQGFLSRTLLVYSGDTLLRPIFEEENEDQGKFKKLSHDLKIIGKLCGKMTFNAEAAKLISDWHMAKGPPTPDHPKLQHYNTRRTAHLLKLCMIASAAESDGLEITVDHYQIALDWLLECERAMPDIFKSMTAGGDSKAMQELWHFLYTTYMREGKKPIAEHRAVAFLQDRVPAHSVMRIIEVMERSKLLQGSIEKGVGKSYIPKPPKTT